MNRGQKLRAARARRIADWDSMPSVGSPSPNTKLVRSDAKGYAAFHKPGSMSGRKGYGKRAKVVKKK